MYTDPLVQKEIKHLPFDVEQMKDGYVGIKVIISFNFVNRFFNLK